MKSSPILRIAIAITFCLAIAPTLGWPQLVEGIGSPGMQTADARYASETQSLDFALVCESQVPITAWAIEIMAHRAGGSAVPARIVEDSAIQYASPKDLNTAPDHDSGVCFRGQRRHYTQEVPLERGQGLLNRITVEVKALVFADRRARGDKELINNIVELRETQRRNAAEEAAETRALLDSPDSLAALRALREHNQRQAVEFASTSTHVNPVGQKAKARAEDLQLLETQIDEFHFDLRQILEAKLERQKAQVRTMTEHKEIIGPY